MNKYQEALEIIKNTFILKTDSAGLTVGMYHNSEFKLIQELINLNTPEKVHWFEDEVTCPSCCDVIDDDYYPICKHCGQRLDWD